MRALTPTAAIAGPEQQQQHTCWFQQNNAGQTHTPSTKRSRCCYTSQICLGANRLRLSKLTAALTTTQRTLLRHSVQIVCLRSRVWGEQVVEPLRRSKTHLPSATTELGQSPSYHYFHVAHDCQRTATNQRPSPHHSHTETLSPSSAVLVLDDGCQLRVRLLSVAGGHEAHSPHVASAVAGVGLRVTRMNTQQSKDTTNSVKADGGCSKLLCRGKTCPLSCRLLPSWP